MQIIKNTSLNEQITEDNEIKNREGEKENERQEEEKN
jgi:hypothetical protein